VLKDLTSGCLILQDAQGIQKALHLTGVNQAANLHIIPYTVPVSSN
jgi:hypothetical protein